MQQICDVQKPDTKKLFLGKQSKFDLFKLKTVSHNDPEIQLDDNELKVVIQASEPTKITANLTNVNTGQEHKDKIFYQADENEVITFDVSIPEPGYYKFQIFALPASEDSKTLFGVYNYLVMCTKANKPVHAFPKQYASWKSGCYLNKPLFIGDNNLSDVIFDVKIPGALDVALTVEGNWVHLTQPQPHAAQWEGSINLKDYVGKNVKLALNANFGGEKNKYSTLLVYTL